MEDKLIDWRYWLDAMGVTYPDPVMVFRKKEAGYDLIYIQIGELKFRVQVRPGEGEGIPR